MGSGCFSYTTKKGRVDVKKYYEVPAEFLEDQERLLGLANESIDVARKAKKSK
jgi:DNA transformation protein